MDERRASATHPWTCTSFWLTKTTFIGLFCCCNSYSESLSNFHRQDFFLLSPSRRALISFPNRHMQKWIILQAFWKAAESDGRRRLHDNSKQRISYTKILMGKQFNKNPCLGGRRFSFSLIRCCKCWENCFPLLLYRFCTHPQNQPVTNNTSKFLRRVKYSLSRIFGTWIFQTIL